MDNTILYGAEAQEYFKRGVDLVANTVKVTLGKKGLNVMCVRDGMLPVITKDGVSVAREVQHSDTIINAGAMAVKQVAVKTVEDAGDGCQDLNSKILTPYGFKRFGDIKVGDDICGTNGTIQKVEATYRKGVKQLYKFTFTDKRTVEACDSHIWKTITCYGKEQHLTTKQLIDSGTVSQITPNGSKKHGYYIPNTFVDFIEKENFPLDPYLIGILLGDGSLSGTGSVELSLGFKKEHILSKIILPQGITYISRVDEKKNCIRVRFSGTDENGLAIKDLLATLGLMGVKSATKFIPKSYLYSSLENRKQLLQGLMDTDGYFSDRNLFQYSSISEQLIDDVIELFRGLGRPITKRKKNRKAGGSYSMTPIYDAYERKGYKYGIQLASIEPTDKFVEVQCIKVSNEDSLYITEDYIVTHNTSTSVVLAQAIVEFAQEALQTTNAIAIKRGIDLATEEVVKHLKNISQKSNSAKRIREIAEISANGDKEISKLVVEAIKKVGQFGIIKTEEVERVSSDVEVSTGYEFDSPFNSWSWITNHEKLTAEFKDMNVLIYEGHIEDWAELVVPINSITSEDGTKVDGLLIISDSIDPQVERQLLEYKAQGFKFMYVKSPSFGARRTETLQDIAHLLDTEVFSKENGNSLENVTVEKLGKIKKVITDSNKTVLIGGEGNTTERLRVVQEQLKVYKGTPKDKEYIKERIGKLTGGVAIINVGGYSDVERREKTDRVEDALCAVRAALEEGFVAGGGTTFLMISKILDGFETSEKNMIGVKIVQKALKAPFLQIYKNAGIETEKHEKYLQSAQYGIGLDIETEEYTNFFEKGIIDPTKVERVAIQNAASIAGTFLTIGSIVYNNEPILRG